EHNFLKTNKLIFVCQKFLKPESNFPQASYVRRPRLVVKCPTFGAEKGFRVSGLKVSGLHRSPTTQP
ncbi:MAG TPA: hypothetical protein PK228_19250, partial [Saprospiraceae bacterium]|nr:hypothetical protein [Saprospiraceae bacterium]